jgi:penicillin amidase
MWVVGGEKTDGKTTMLLNGPQMAFYVPAYHHEVGLHGAGFDIVGTAPVGYPAILFGHNKNITFGATAAGGNTTDIFILKLARDQYHYVHNGQVLDMQKRTETIKVRGGPPVTVDVYRSIYGPVFQWGDGFAVTKERAWEGKAVESLIGWIDCTKAHNFSQFAEGLTKCAMPANRTYADKMGNIGYIHNGRFPIRHPEVDTRLPTPGTGEYDWQGYHPFSWNPKILNPSQGFLANWNNRPSLNYPSGDKIWNSYDRVYRIIKDLKSKKKITFEDMKKINEDIGFIHLTADYFMPYFLNGIGGNLDPQMTEAINRLVSWNRYQVDNNHDGYYDDPGLTIWNQWYAEALKATLQDDLGPNYYRDDSLFLHVLQGDKSDVALSRDYLNGVALSGMLRESLSTALSALKAQFGTDIMSLWLTKTKRHVFQTNNFLGISQGEVKVRDLHQEMNRGTQNHIVVLGRGRVTGVNVNPPGEIGFIHPNGTPSPHYSDQLDIFEDYKGYKPMLHDKDQVLSNLELVEFIVVD